MNYEDKMDAIIGNALRSEETLPVNFTRKVMERVACTPQKRAVPRKKVIASVAACAAVLLLAVPVLRLTTVRMGSSADCAEAEYMPDNAAAAEEPAVEEPAEFFAASEDSCIAEEEYSVSEAQKSADPAVVINDVTLCADVRLWLEENGFPAAEDEQQIEFTLTDEQIAALEKAFPEVVFPDGADTVYLEG